MDMQPCVITLQLSVIYLEFILKQNKAYVSGTGADCVLQSCLIRIALYMQFRLLFAVQFYWSTKLQQQ